MSATREDAAPRIAERDDWVLEARRALPGLRDVAYFNTGMLGPLPGRTAARIQADLERELRRGQGGAAEREKLGFRLMRARAVAARVLGARPEEIALTHHTSDGVNIVLSGLPWRSGDELCVTSLEHEAVMIPAELLRERLGITLRVAEIGRGERALQGLEAVVSGRTRLVIVSHIAFGTGAVLPIEPIARLCKERGALVLVDGAQTCGAQPVDVKALGVEFYTLSGHKWLCGPEGTGALYVRADWVERLRCASGSYHSVASYDRSSGVTLHPNARRFEVGTVFYPKWAGFIASVEWLLNEVGIERAGSRSRALALLARAKLGAIEGIEIVTPAALQAHLLAFTIEGRSGADLDQMARALAERARVVLRTCAGPPAVLRASLAFFNTEDDIERLAQGVADLIQGRDIG